LQERAETTLPEQDAREMMTAALLLCGLRVGRQELVRLFSGVPGMHESSAYEMILEEGRIEGKRDLLLRQGRNRFGPPSKAALATFQAINDEERLNRMGDRLPIAKNWHELLETP
jgi:hypothetical protein